MAVILGINGREYSPHLILDLKVLRNTSHIKMLFMENQVLNQTQAMESETFETDDYARRITTLDPMEQDLSTGSATAPPPPAQQPQPINKNPKKRTKTGPFKTVYTDEGFLVIDLPMEQEIIEDQAGTMETEGMPTNETFENGQRITTQDLTEPDLSTDCLPPINKNPRKRSRSEPCISELNKIRDNSMVPAWVKAENALRLSFWNNSKGRKLLNTCYTVPDSNDELNCYNMTNNKCLVYVRVLCSFFVPQKITIGCYGSSGGKCDFEVLYLDEVLSALTAISKGAKSKTVNFADRDGKMKIDSANGALHFSRLYPNDIKNFVRKNNMSPFLVREDTKFTVPSTEIDQIKDVLLDAVQFLTMKRRNAHQRKTVFQIATRELRQSEPLTNAQFAIKLFEIYYGLDLADEDKYPLSVVLPEYYKLFAKEM